MNLIRPLAISNAILSTSSVPETDYAVWSNTTNYVTGNRCIVLGMTHRCYEALQTSVGANPPDYPSHWLDLGPTNRWRMFDGQSGTATTAADSIEVILTPGGVVNSIALLELDADQVTVSVVSDIEGEVYNQTVSLVSDQDVTDWYLYFFEPITRRTDIVLQDLPAMAFCGIWVTITNTGETAACGLLAIGTLFELGDLRWEPQISILDYSRKTTDSWGNPTLEQRNYAKLLSGDITLLTNRLDEVRRMLALYRATPLVWVGCDLYSSLIVYGFYRSFRLILAGPVDSECSIEIEGLT